MVDFREPLLNIRKGKLARTEKKAQQNSINAIIEGWKV